MLHLVIFIICIISVELIAKSNFINRFIEISKWSKKSFYLLKNSKISDHWKEIVIPVYALKIMKLSLFILFILLLIITLFLLANQLFENLLSYLFSIYGILESLIVAYLYFIFRKIKLKQ